MNSNNPTTPFAVEMLPANEQAEAALLSTCLTHPRQFQKVKDTLTPADFYRLDHGEAWNSFLAIDGDGLQVGPITLADQLTRRGKLETFAVFGSPAHGEAAIAALLASDRANIRDVDTLVAIIQNCSGKRQIFYTLSRHVEPTLNGRPAPEIIKSIQDDLARIVLTTGPHQSEILTTEVALGHAMDAMMAKSDGRDPTISTGLLDLDRLLGGWHKGRSIIVAGRPGEGKTSLLLTTAVHAARHLHKRVGIFSLEMQSDELMNRIISQESGIPGEAIRDGKLTDEQWPLYSDWIDRLGSMTLHICQSERLDMGLIRTFARKMSYLGLDMLCIDYIGLITPYATANNREQEVSQISREIKLLARELNIPILTACQMNRSIETRADKEPQLSDLRESGSIEQDSDVVIFVYHPQGSEQQNIVNLKVGKHRAGITGIVQTYFSPTTTKFSNVTTHVVPLNDTPVRDYVK